MRRYISAIRQYALFHFVFIAPPASVGPSCRENNTKTKGCEIWRMTGTFINDRTTYKYVTFR